MLKVFSCFLSLSDILLFIYLFFQHKYFEDPFLQTFCPSILISVFSSFDFNKLFILYLCPQQNLENMLKS